MVQAVGSCLVPNADECRFRSIEQRKNLVTREQQYCGDAGEQEHQHFLGRFLQGGQPRGRSAQRAQRGTNHLEMRIVESAILRDFDHGLEHQSRHLGVVASVREFGS